MASSGSYSIRASSATYGYFTLTVNWSEKYISASNKHRVTITSVELSEGQCHDGYPTGTISINGQVVMDMNAVNGKYRIDTNSSSRIMYNNSVATAYADINGNQAGAVNIAIAVGGNWAGNIEYGIAFYSGSSGNVISPFFKGSSTVATIYTLSVNAGSGSIITVNRKSAACNSGTGSISNGAKIYSGDVLKISYSAVQNYTLLTHTVNGKSFSSGGTKTVSGNITVAATARPLSSSVAATDANIGSVSSITVTRYSSSYYHSLQYSFGSIQGYITPNGNVQNTEVKMQETSVPFTIPLDFYTHIPNSKTGTCTITCRTYASSSATNILGTAETCSFIITASSQSSCPIVSGTVVDVNNNTIQLTGDSSKLIKYRSTARATINAEARNSAIIESKMINETVVPNAKIDYENTEIEEYIFRAIDSRGYSASITISPSVIAYIPLTLNVILSRPSPTSNNINLSFNGNYYNGSFGAFDNTLNIQYRYRENNNSSFSSWITINSNNYSIYSDYFTSAVINLEDTFLYTKSFEFEVRAIDGASGVNLSTVISKYIVPNGMPIFDWGKDDFNFHVPIRIGDAELTEERLNRLVGGDNYVNTLDPISISSSSGRRNAVWFKGGVRLTYADDIDTYFTVVLAKKLESGKTYTLSFKCSGIDGVEPIPSFRIATNGSTIVNNLALKDGLVQCTFTMPIDSSDKILFDDVGSRPKDTSIELTEWQIEDGGVSTGYRPSWLAIESKVNSIGEMTRGSTSLGNWDIGLIDEKYCTASLVTEKNVTTTLDNDTGIYCIDKTEPFRIVLPYPMQSLNLVGSSDRYMAIISNTNPIKNADAVVGANFLIGTHKAISNENMVIRLINTGVVKSPPRVVSDFQYDASIGAQICEIADTYVAAQKNGAKFNYGKNFFYTNCDIVNRVINGVPYARVECDTYAGLVLRGVTYDKSPFKEGNYTLTTYIDQDDGNTYQKVSGLPSGIHLYDKVMADTANDIPSWATNLRNMIAGKTAMDYLGAPARWASTHAWLFWTIRGSVFSDAENAMPGDVAFFRERQTADWFDGITHIAIVGERDLDGYMTIYEVTGSVESGGRILQHVSLKNRSTQPSYFARPYGWST